MQELIPIGSASIEGDVIQTVNARDLHAFLGSNQDFTTWIKARIQKYGFVEGDDFTLHKTVERRVTKAEYHVTIDMAKELSMVERSYQGKQARLYFLECERRAKAAAKPAPLSLDDPHALRSALLSYSEKVIALEAKVIEDTPKVESYEALIACDEGQSMADVAQACVHYPQYHLGLFRRGLGVHRSIAAYYPPSQGLLIRWSRSR